MTSFIFPERILCFRVRFRIRVEVRDRVSRNTFKFVFGQTFIRASVLDPYRALRH